MMLLFRQAFSSDLVFELIGRQGSLFDESLRVVQLCEKQRL